ncbi:MAG: ABC transporter permease [Acidimicrobiia bacterium]|nr:ABC transporter permease [Acidimicrobiia bacterium]
MDLDLFTSVLSISVFAGTSLIYATVGEIITERAGILNLGVEGMMIMGAVTAFAGAFHSGSLLAGLIVAMAVGGLMALVHAFVTITLRADQIVSGLALTLAGVGLASFIGERLGPDNGPLVGLRGPRFLDVDIPGLSELPVIGEALFQQDPIVYSMYVFVPLVWFYFYRTRPGQELRAMGESPQTVDAMGIPVIRWRYIYTIVGGMLAGFGGAHLSLAYTPGWSENLTGGRGWIAIALVIFATWSPARAVVGALLFGGVNAVQFRLQASGTSISANLLNMAPYVLTVLVLVLISGASPLRKRLGAPAALGVPYAREERT